MHFDAGQLHSNFGKQKRNKRVASFVVLTPSRKYWEKYEQEKEKQKMLFVSMCVDLDAGVCMFVCLFFLCFVLFRLNIECHSRVWVQGSPFLVERFLVSFSAA